MPYKTVGDGKSINMQSYFKVATYSKIYIVFMFNAGKPGLSRHSGHSSVNISATQIIQVVPHSQKKCYKEAEPPYPLSFRQNREYKVSPPDTIWHYLKLPNNSLFAESQARMSRSSRFCCFLPIA